MKISKRTNNRKNYISTRKCFENWKRSILKPELDSLGRNRVENCFFPSFLWLQDKKRIAIFAEKKQSHESSR